MAERLDESFNPKEKESMALLKTFRATIESRRKWGREYRLLSFTEEKPETKPAHATPEIRPGKNGTAPSRPTLSQEALTIAAIDDVVRSFTKNKSDPQPAANGLLCR